MLSYDKLSDAQITAELAGVPGWQLEGDQITRLFEFESYASGAVFALAVAHVADTLNHHPDLLIGYRKVRVSVSTHDAGGLTAYDFELARRVNGLVQ